MGRHNADLEGTIFGLIIDVDFKDPERYAVYLGQAGPWSARSRLLFEAGFRGAESEIPKLRREIASSAQLAGRGQARGVTSSTLNRSIAEASWTKTQQRDPIATYNPMSIAELETFAPNFPWRPFLAEADSAKSRT